MDLSKIIISIEEIYEDVKWVIYITTILKHYPDRLYFIQLILLPPLYLILSCTYSRLVFKVSQYEDLYNLIDQKLNDLQSID